MSSRHEQEEYLEQDEAERDSAGRCNSLVERLSSVSALQDCLMTHATNCANVSPPPPVAPAGRNVAPSTTR